MIKAIKALLCGLVYIAIATERHKAKKPTIKPMPHKVIIITTIGRTVIVHRPISFKTQEMG